MFDTNRAPVAGVAASIGSGSAIDSLNNACGQIAPHSFYNIPGEMANYHQFVLWRFEDAGDGKKPTKVLCNAFTGQHASVDDPATWCSAEQAISTYERGGYAGIGFVLTERDPYCFIDLDDTSGKPDHAELFERQKRIYGALQSYTELSPSGSGLHIITNRAFTL